MNNYFDNETEKPYDSLGKKENGSNWLLFSGFLCIAGVFLVVQKLY